MSDPVINTPRGSVVITKRGKAKLVWNSNFRKRWQRKYSAAQKFMDSEVLRLCEPLTPLRTGMLVKSGTLGTDMGSGLVEWIAPYAKKQYYSARPAGAETGPERGPYWFARMKEKHQQYLIEGARRMAGGGKSE